MRECEDDSDCRSGYQCLDLSRDPSRKVVDTDSGKRVCVLPPANGAPPMDALPDGGVKGEPAVCFPSDASFDVSRPETGPSPRDAPSEVDVPGTSDGTIDRGDVNGPEGGNPDATNDAADSNHVETGSDTVDDTAEDVETDSDDAASEPDVTSDDVNGPD